MAALTLSPDALADRMRAGTPPSLFDDTTAMLLPLDADASAPVGALPPCPVIGIGHGPAAWAAACDVRVADTDAATPLLQRIEATPRAAAVFVQLLRHTEGLPRDAALFAESLSYSTLQAGPEYQAWLAAHRADHPTPHRDTGPAVMLERSGPQLQLWLNRASTRNAMSREMRDALIEALQLVQLDPEIREVRLAGHGKCFSTGGDLSEFGSAPDPATAHLVRSLALPGAALAACRDRVTVRVHGACIGSGIEFPAFAGRIEAHQDAWFQLPELRFGLIPGAGGCISLPRRIGRQRTAWMVLGGARVTAATALDWGLVDALV